MPRSPLDLATIARWDNLMAAFHAASRGRRDRATVQDFAARLDRELDRIRREILDGVFVPGPGKRFWIRDPKLRLIEAPPFRDRVIHHAVMASVGPVLERSLVFDTYACREGKGTLAAVRRCQAYARRFPVFAKIDISRYFPSIDHAILSDMLARRFKNRALLRFLDCIIVGESVAPGKGLPIGTLTSQHFANYYLDGADRHLLEHCRVRGLVRYMDDIARWCDSAEAARGALDSVSDFLEQGLRLAIKPPQIGRNSAGMSFCGFRTLPGALRLSRRRRRRYAIRRRFWEHAYLEGGIDAATLQAGYRAALAITAHADAAAWRREQLRRSPVAPALLDV